MASGGAVQENKISSPENGGSDLNEFPTDVLQAGEVKWRNTRKNVHKVCRVHKFSPIYFSL